MGRIDCHLHKNIETILIQNPHMIKCDPFPAIYIDPETGLPTTGQQDRLNVQRLLVPVVDHELARS